MFAKILVGTDGSDSAAKAVAQAAAIAKTAGAELLVLHSYPIVSAGSGGPLGGAETVPLKEIGVGILEDVRKKYAKGIPLRTLLKEGAPGDAIVDVAEEEKVDLIVVGNRGMTGAKRYVLGSVPNNVSHHAPTSILIVDTTSPRSEASRKGGEAYKKVLVATDGSPTAGKAAETGAELAAAMGGEVLLVSVGAESQASTILEKAAKHLAASGATIATKTASGDPADMIITLAEKQGSDLVVVGNKGMTGSKRFLLGSVPDHVSHHSPCDVLIVKTT